MQPSYFAVSTIPNFLVTPAIYYGQGLGEVPYQIKDQVSLDEFMLLGTISMRGPVISALPNSCLFVDSFHS